ncbi:MAG: ArsR/SmtB family transcription factor [Actinomycetota bacterium]|nr:metalloregulator ArsR/SmtB family transcription factor [Actinomycetota bacterium]
MNTRTQLPVLCCVPMASQDLTDDDADAAAQLFKAMSDPHRVKIVNLLLNSDEPVCVCDLTEALQLAQPTVSFHLKKLTQVGLIERHQRGTWAYFSMKPKAMTNLSKIFKKGKYT